MHRRLALLLGLNDLEVVVAFRAKHFRLDVGDDSLPRWLVREAIKERANFAVITLDFERHPVRAVADKAAQTELRGIAIDRGPKADALDATNNLRAHAGFHSRTTPSWCCRCGCWWGWMMPARSLPLWVCGSKCSSPAHTCSIQCTHSSMPPDVLHET
jgi:hypothetical protein